MSVESFCVPRGISSNFFGVGMQSWASGKYPLIEHEYDAIVV